jgi:alkylation response protein AidB-like acyl-CoA dehydrogenase
MSEPNSAIEKAALLDSLCAKLTANAHRWQTANDWPAESLAACAQAGVFRWFVPKTHGGWEWTDEQITRGYLRLSAACLTTTFILTQRTGAVQRMVASGNQRAIEHWLGDLLAGTKFATLAISHLTTSRRHLTEPILQATQDGNGFVLNGYSAWVTGADRADVVVTGATLDDGRQILVALPTELSGIGRPTPPELIALSASRTGPLYLDHVHVPSECLLMGPSENVMRSGGGGTGGLQTSTLAVGLASAAVSFIEAESLQRLDLVDVAAQFRVENAELTSLLLTAASGQPSCSNDELRGKANLHVLRSTQAALAAAKGAGFVQEHPVGRWAREALFFLVWSCPQGVLSSNLCELAGIA